MRGRELTEAAKPLKGEALTVDQVERALNDPAWASVHYFGVEFEASGTLADRAEEVAYAVGYEKAKSGRHSRGIDGLRVWAKHRGVLDRVNKSYDQGMQDGGG